MTDMHEEERLARMRTMTDREVMEKVLQQAQELPSDTVRTISAVLQISALLAANPNSAEAFRCAGSLLVMARYLKLGGP